MEKKTIIKRSINIILFFFLFGISREGIVSQVILNSVSLDEVLNNSCCVVVAKKADPFIRTEQISTTPPEDATGKKFPPFTKTSYRFVVLEALTSAKDISPGRVIQVVSPSEQHHLVMHKAHYLGRPVPSVNIPSYQDHPDPDRPDTLILFLSDTDDSNFVFTVENAFESVSNKSEILSRLNKAGGRK